jgi:hypothetical protein
VKKARVLGVFFGFREFFLKLMLGSPIQAIRHLFEFSSFPLLAKILAKMMSFQLAKRRNGGKGIDFSGFLQIIQL